MTLVDSHCHLNMSKIDTPTLLATAKDEGVGHFLNISVNLQDFPQVLQAAHDFDNVYATVGLHPNTDPANESTAEELIALAADPRILGIGETGLDYYYNKGDMTWQHERFRYHIRAARECQKPLIIHCRDAKDDVLRILKEEKADEVGGIMHCFVEDYDTAAQAMDMGFYISFSGIVTFKSAKDLQQVAQRIPQDRLLVETDSPYLAPVPYRGKPNQPAYVRKVAEFIADLREQSYDSLARATTENFFRLFALNH